MNAMVCTVWYAQRIYEFPKEDAYVMVHGTER